MKFKIVLLFCLHAIVLLSQKINVHFSEEKLAATGSRVPLIRNDKYYCLLFPGDEDRSFKLVKYDSRTSRLLASKSIVLPQSAKTLVNGKYFFAVGDRIALFYMVEYKKLKRTVIFATHLGTDLSLSSEAVRVDSVDYIGVSNYTLIDNYKISFIRSADNSRSKEVELSSTVFDTSFTVLKRTTIFLPFKKSEGNWEAFRQVSNNRFMTIYYDAIPINGSKTDKGDYLVCYNMIDGKLTHTKITWPDTVHCYRIKLFANKKNQINIFALYTRQEDGNKSFNNSYSKKLDGAITIVFDETGATQLQTRRRDLNDELDRAQLKGISGFHYELSNVNLFEDNSIAITCERYSEKSSSYSSGSLYSKVPGSTDSYHIEFLEVIVFNLTENKDKQWLKIFNKLQEKNAYSEKYPHLLHSVFVLNTPGCVALFMNANVKNIPTLKRTPDIFELGELRNDKYASETRAFMIDAGGSVRIKEIPELGKVQIGPNGYKLYLTSASAILFGTQTDAGNFASISID